VELRKKEQELSVSQRVIAEQEEELAEVAKELEVTESENSRLRRSMELIMGEGARRYAGYMDASDQLESEIHC
jgi:replicative DNA helicase